jgi:hypothetical protein
MYFQTFTAFYELFISAIFSEEILGFAEPRGSQASVTPLIVYFIVSVQRIIYIVSRPSSAIVFTFQVI